MNYPSFLNNVTTKASVVFLLIVTFMIMACSDNQKDINGKYTLGSESIVINPDGTGKYISPPVNDNIHWSKDGNTISIKGGMIDGAKLQYKNNSLIFSGNGAKYLKNN